MRRDDLMAPSATQEQGSTLLTPYDLHLVQRRQAQPPVRKVWRARDRIRRQAWHLLRGMGAQRGAHLGGRRLQRLESRFASHEPAGELRRLGGVRPRSRPGRGLQVPHPLALSHVRRSTRPILTAIYNEVPPRTASIVWDLDYEWNDGEWMRTRHERNKFDAPHLDLRSASRLVDARARGRQSLADLSRAGGQAGRLRQRHGLHPRRVSAGDGASVLRLVGLPGHRLLRAQRALRHAAGLHVPGRLSAPARHRRHPRLGAVALSQRRARPGLLRRHASVRARRSAQGLSSRLEVGTSSTTAATKCAAS